MPSGTPVEPPSPASARARSLLGRLSRGAGTGAETAYRAFVRRSDDRRLERSLGSERGLRLLFSAMARRFDPAAADGFTGQVAYQMLGMDGVTRSWTVEVGSDAAQARQGPATAPALVVRLGLADLVRLSAGDLDPGEAVLTGRLDLEGDLAVAMRLGPMFRMDGALG